MLVGIRLSGFVHLVGEEPHPGVVEGHLEGDLHELVVDHLDVVDEVQHHLTLHPERQLVKARFEGFGKPP